MNNSISTCQRAKLNSFSCLIAPVCLVCSHISYDGQILIAYVSDKQVHLNMSSSLCLTNDHVKHPISISSTWHKSHWMASLCPDVILSFHSCKYCFQFLCGLFISLTTFKQHLNLDCECMQNASRQLSYCFDLTTVQFVKLNSLLF